uniref:Uncharacterized protein n=1 Tax=Anopheles minimus TaxID=112268 RepID=A0A182W670_9DIPT
MWDRSPHRYTHLAASVPYRGVLFAVTVPGIATPEPTLQSVPVRYIIRVVLSRMARNQKPSIKHISSEGTIPERTGDVAGTLGDKESSERAPSGLGRGRK